MRASVRLAHNSYDCDSTGCPYWLGLEERGELRLIVFGDGTDDFDQLGRLGYFVLAGCLTDELMEVDLCPLLVVLY